MGGWGRRGREGGRREVGREEEGRGGESGRREKEEGRMKGEESI